MLRGGCIPWAMLLSASAHKPPGVLVELHVLTSEVKGRPEMLHVQHAPGDAAGPWVTLRPASPLVLKA